MSYKADATSDKFFTIESEHSYSTYDTYEKAEKCAREGAYTNGYKYWVMAPIAAVSAPQEVNTVKVSKL